MDAVAAVGQPLLSAQIFHRGKRRDQGFRSFAHIRRVGRQARVQNKQQSLVSVLFGNGLPRQQQWRQARGCQMCKARALLSPFQAAADEKTLQLPINYFQLLGAAPHMTNDEIRDCFAAAINDIPGDNAPFSLAALAARREVLETARDTLLDPILKREYMEYIGPTDQGVLTPVTYSVLPGVMILLVESGADDLVLETGRALLAEKALSKEAEQDVLLAMALSSVEIARGATAENPPQVAKACEYLEGALKMLRHAGRQFASELQEQIDSAIEEMTPTCILQLLALPLDQAHAAERQEGLTGVRDVLWAQGDRKYLNPKGMERSEFMKQAFGAMTAAEQVALFVDTPYTVPAGSGEVYAAALAHVAEGFTKKKPRLIQDADSLLSQLQATSKTSPSDDIPRDVSLERALCAMLLGRIEDTKAWLARQSDQSLVDYVYAQSGGPPGTVDPLNGLCVLTADWLRDVIFVHFRDTAKSAVDLRDYFDDPGVTSYLDSLQGGSPLYMAEQLARRATTTLGTLPSQALQAVSSFFASQRTPGTPASTIGTTPTASSPSRVSAAQNISAREKAGLGPRRSSPRLTLSPEPSLTSSSGVQLPPVPEASNVPKAEPKGAGKSRGLLENSLGYLVACGLLAAVTVVGFRVVVKGNNLQVKGPEVATVENAMQPIDSVLAERVVRKWYAVKSVALGKEHDGRGLKEVLQDQMLTEWSQKVEEARRLNIYWAYKLQALNVKSVAISENGRRAVVEVTFQEYATVFDGATQKAKDATRHTYSMKYELKHSPTAGWKISGGQVVGT